MLQKDQLQPTPVEVLKEALEKDAGPGSSMSQHIRALILLYGIDRLEHAEVWELVYDILFLDPVTAHLFAGFRGMWECCERDHRACEEWWDLFLRFLVEFFCEEGGQMDSYWQNNPSEFGHRLPHGPDQLRPGGVAIAWFPDRIKTRPLYPSIWPPSAAIVSISRLIKTTRGRRRGKCGSTSESRGRARDSNGQRGLKTAVAAVANLSEKSPTEAQEPVRRKRSTVLRDITDDGEGENAPPGMIKCTSINLRDRILLKEKDVLTELHKLKV